MSVISDLFGIKRITIGKGANHSNKVIGYSEYSIRQDQKDFAFDNAYAASSDVYAITNKIARNGKTIPWRLYRQTGDEKREITDGPLYDLIQNPNESQSLAEYIEQSMLMILLSGNLYVNPQTPLGFTKASEVYNLFPQLTTIENQFGGKINKVKEYTYRIDGREFKISPEDVTHVRYANPTTYGINNLYGLSPLVAGYLTLVGLTNNQTAHASILENQGAAGILSNESDYALTPEQRDLQQKLFDKKASGATKFGKIIQSLSKVNYTKIGLDPSALKIIEGKTLKMRDLCNIYDVSSVLFNDPQNRIQSNLTPAETAFWANAVLPNATLVKEAFERAVLAPYNKGLAGGKYFLELDTSGIQALRKDDKLEAETAKIYTEVVKGIVSMPIAREAKVELLVAQLEMSQDAAEAIVAPEGSANSTLEKLKSLSPVLANKIIDKFTEEEIKALLS